MNKYEAIESNSKKELTTSVDQLLQILKSKDKMPLGDAAEELGVPVDVVQSWVDFLVEEQIVGIEYKFTKPYIYLNQAPEKEEEKEEEQHSFETFKTDFVNKAKNKEIPKKNIHTLWEKHVEQALENRKLFFMQEASKRNLDHIDDLWEEYRQKLEGI